MTHDRRGPRIGKEVYIPLTFRSQPRISEAQFTRLRDWCERINERYINQRGLDTVDKAIPVYAPASDGNNERTYIDHVNRLVADWVAEDTEAPAQSPTALRNSLLHASFGAVKAQWKSEQAFHQYMVSELKAGRPLGNPLAEQQTVTINGQAYVLQVFAMDTITRPCPAGTRSGG